MKLILNFLNDSSQLVFWPLFLLIYFKFNKATYVGGDEFSFWGFASKIIYQTSHFITKTSVIYSKDYIPGTQMLHYYFYGLFGYSEGISYVAALAVFLAFFVIFVPYILKLKTFLPKLLFGGAILLFPLLNLNPLLTVGTEYLLSLSFVFLYLFEKEGSDFTIGRIAILIVGVSFLVLLKHMGFFFALFFVLSSLFKTIWAQLKHEQVNYKLDYIISVILILVIVFVQKSWAHYVGVFLDKAPFTVKINFELIQKTQEHRNLIPSYYKLILEAFFNGFFIRGFLKLEIQTFLLLGIAYKFYCNETNKKEIWNLLLFYIAYLVLMLASYFFVFGDYEAIHVASFQRYIGTYVVSIQIFAIFMIIKNYDMKKLKMPAIILLIPILHIFSRYTFPYLIHEFVTVDHGLTLQRQIIKDDAQYFISKIPKMSSVYIFSQQTTGEQRLNFAYELDDSKVNTGCWAIVNKGNNGDPWTCVLGEDGVKKLLTDFDYVYINKADKQLADLFLKEFTVTIKDRDKFKINKLSSTLALEKI